MDRITIQVVSRELLPCEPERKAVRHAATLLALPDGSILAGYFAGTYEGEPDVDIYVTRRGVDGRWSTPRRSSREEGIAHWNPILARRSSGEVVLYYKVGFEIGSWKTMERVSRDGGASWSAPRELVPGDSGGRGPVRNKLIVLQDGAWLAGGSFERGQRWCAFADRSEDEGRTWERSGDIAIAADLEEPPLEPRPSIQVSDQSFRGRGVIQPTLWESAPSVVHMLLRSSEGFVYRSDSVDGGRGWCEPYATLLPNNNSALDLVRLDRARLLLAHNPVGGNWGERTPLVLSVSANGAGAWKRVLVLDEGPGEFSYPAIVRDGPDTVLVSWTRNRTEIALARVSHG
jgi:predicted neuraminidase